MARNPLNPRLPPFNPKTGRRNKKRFKHPGKYPAVGALIKAKWQDPEYRAKMKERDRNRIADIPRNPHKYSRLGVPDGLTREKVRPMWQNAYKLGDEFIKIMKKTGEIPEIVVPGSDAAKAEAALREAFVLAIGPSDKKVKLAAISVVLNYTKAKPEQRNKLTIDKAEEFLSAVANDIDDDAKRSQ